MKIAIVGGGSIGLLFAYYLNQEHKVVLYVRNPEQMKELRENGLFLNRSKDTYHTVVDVKSTSEWGMHHEDLTVICVKQYHLPSLLDHAELSEEHPLLFVQNGMGHLKKIEQLKNRRIFVASVEHGALKMSNNEVSHTGNGVTRMAVFRGDRCELIDKLALSLENIFPFIWEKDYYNMLVKKLVVNAIINPLTAILRVPNGQLLENPFYYELLTRLFNEVKAILQLENGEDYFNNLVHVCKNTAKNRSSMLKDIEENRPTEVDAILGFLLDEAYEKEIAAPLVYMLYNMIKGSESQRKG